MIEAHLKDERIGKLYIFHSKDGHKYVGIVRAHRVNVRAYWLFNLHNALPWGTRLIEDFTRETNTEIEFIDK